MASSGDGESRRPTPSSSPAWYAEGDPPDKALHALGFEFTRITASEVVGRLAVTDTCCQPFKMLNGGVSALIAEAAASIGGYIASGYRRVAGVQLSINHLRPARQVWEVQIWRMDPSTLEGKSLLSTARVTLLVNLSTPEEMKNYQEGIKKYAKL